jgi:hypothetical protein
MFVVSDSKESEKDNGQRDTGGFAKFINIG